MIDATDLHPKKDQFTKLFKEKVDPYNVLRKMDLSFANHNWIKSIKQPLFILHAKDDKIIPFAQGLKLFDQGVKRQAHVKLVEFDTDLNLGHKGIYKYDHLFNIISKVIKDINSSQVSMKHLEFHGHDGHHWHNGHRTPGT